MVKRAFSRRLLALLVAGAAVSCTAIVGVDKDYELDPGGGKAGSVATGGAARGGSGGSETGGAAGSGGVGTGGAPSTDGGEDAGGASGKGGAADASAGAAGTSGAGGTGGASGQAGSGGTGGAAGTGGASDGSAGTAGSGGSGTAGTGGGAGTAGGAGAGGAAGAAGNAGASGAAGAAGSAVDASGDVDVDVDGDPTDGSGGASPDASSDPPVDLPQDVGSPCGPGTKLCGGLCVPTADPSYGCANVSCAPCEPNGTATCTSGNCVVTGCNAGYHQVGNVCVANVPEVCTNGADDDGDTRADCLDSDCATHSSCGGKCMEALPVACDTILPAQSTGATGSTSRINSYSCSGSTYIASEYAYRFTGGANQRVYAEIYGLSGNLGLFQIGVPSGSQCLAGTSCGTFSDATGTGAEALGFTTQPGQDYYLVVDGPFVPRSYGLSVQCSTLDGCWPRRPIEAGQSFSASNNPASGAINVTASKVPSYNCGTVNIGETGPEAAWMFTPTVNANYRASLTALSADCDLFVLPAADCGGSCLGPTTYSANFNQASEFVTFPGVANTTYYIVVEGYADAICTFTIGLMQL